jgi:hypothetical protein
MSHSANNDQNWVREPLKQYRRWINDALLFYDALRRGLRMVTGLPELNEAFSQLPKNLKDEIFPKGQSLEQALTEQDETLSEFVGKEIDDGFPRTHAHLLVSFWSALETFIMDTLLNWMEFQPTCLATPEIERIKIRLVEYNELSNREKSLYIINRLKNEIGSPFKIGVGQFESLLGVFGLSGKIDEGIRRDLLEMSELRNVIVHRRMVADERIITNCPWLGYKIDDPIFVEQSQFIGLIASSIRYAAIIVKREFDILARFKSQVQL